MGAPPEVGDDRRSEANHQAIAAVVTVVAKLATVTVVAVVIVVNLMAVAAMVAGRRGPGRAAAGTGAYRPWLSISASDSRPLSVSS